jgi:class 3 adenylate cyclase/tetratricopeptide (TPR) repeat protein
MGGEPGSAMTSASAEDQSLLRYLPRYRRVAFDPRSRRSFPGVSSAAAAVLRSDIVGFTLLTDRMVKSGIAGAEQLADVLNQVINRMAEITWAQGGELVGWEGDAGTFVWFAHAGLSVDDATVLAIQAAATIHREAESWLVDGAPVRFRSAVSCGSLSHFEIGGRDEWHVILAGSALSGVSSAEKTAAPRQTVISAAAVALVGGRCQCISLDGGTARVVGVIRPADPPAATPESGNVPSGVLRKAVPQILLGGGYKPSRWPGEFRVVTAAYMMLRHPEYASPEDTLATLQDAAQRVQLCLGRFEGQIYEIVAAEEGITFIAVFGLPPLSHEDDPARAVRSALSLHREWGALGLTSSTGIATGRVFFGVFQTNTDRAVLALVGPIMNLAARLMQLNAGVVCDEETRQAGRQSGRIIARQLTPRMIKGKPEPITAYAAYDVGGSTGPARGAEEMAVIGRERELSALSDGLTKARAGMGCVVVIEGDAGIGKSTLVSRTADEASDSGMSLLAGGGDSTDQTTAYLAWRRVLLDLLERSDLTLRAAARRSSSPGSAVEPYNSRSGNAIIRLGAFARLAPLLEDMLGLEAADNDETALLRGQPRADALARLLRDLLFEAAKSAPLVVVMEDMHWLDPTSLSFFANLAACGASLMLLGATRGPDANSAVRKSLAQAEDVQWLRLEPLSAAETGWLLARTLGARQADDDLAAMFRDRTGGNPLFVEELSRMACANRLLYIDGAVQARSSVAAAKGGLDDILERQGLPGTIEGVIRRRLDGLSHRDISVLRAASVVGPTFDRDLCSAGAPVLAPAEVEQSLAALIRLGVIEPLDRTPDQFVFRHEVVRDAVYNSMSFAERRQLHDFVGAWIEQHPHTEDASALLGRHFLQAQRTDKAMRYLIAAGEIAIRRHANAEAAELLTRAYELAQGRQSAASEGGLSQAELARLSLLLGGAFLGLSRYADCRVHNEIGLRQAGFSVPATIVGVALGLLSHVARQVSRRISPSLEAAETEKPMLRKAVLAFEGLAETYFYLGDGLRTLSAAISTLNLSELLGPSPELARGCATVSGIAGLFQLRGISDHYAARALAILRSIDDPAAEIWVSVLIGLSKLGKGEWEESTRCFAKVSAAADRIGDRRRWRDGVENAAIAEACRGNWKHALIGFSEMFASAKQDGDQRYMVLVYRERAYCYLQLGDLELVDGCLRSISQELARGLTAEQVSTQKDLHAIAANVALERGDHIRAAEEANAASKAIAKISGTSSFPNLYWTIFLVARVFANLWLRAAPKGQVDPAVRCGMDDACRALSRQAGSHPIAAPSAAIARGYREQLRGSPARAVRFWQQGRLNADQLHMDYESQLARVALDADSDDSKELGLPFILVDATTDAA